MNQQINVLADMDHAADELDAASENEGYGKSEAARDLRVARAAVAELIEACRPAASEDGWDDAGYARFCAALARCGGAS